MGDMAFPAMSGVRGKYTPTLNWVIIYVGKGNLAWGILGFLCLGGNSTKGGKNNAGIFFFLSLFDLSLLVLTGYRTGLWV